ncbi:hypothetical protein Tco_0387899, partial [Tanacetum coccineum]
MNEVVAISHNLCNLVIFEFNRTKELADKIGELRAIFGHVLKHPESKNTEDGAIEALDPRD